MDDQELSRAEEIAKRAMELSARPEEIARHAHEVAGVDEQMVAVEAELDALLAEEQTLDAGFNADPGRQPGAADDEDEWMAWADKFSGRMEALGDRLGHLMGGLNAALGSSLLGPGRGWTESKYTCPVAGPIPVRVASRGGPVEVRPGSDDQVHVTAQSRGLPGGDPQQHPVTVTERDGIVVVESSPDRAWRNHLIRLEIEVPRLSPVDITTGGGSVRIAGTEGPVRSRTGGGSVTVERAVGEVDVSTGGGSIRIEGHLTGQSSIRTGGGSVQVTLDPGTRIEVDARGTPASIDVPGLRVRGSRVSGLVGGGGDGHLQVRTGGGAVRIEQS